MPLINSGGVFGKGVTYGGMRSIGKKGKSIIFAEKGKIMPKGVCKRDEIDRERPKRGMLIRYSGKAKRGRLEKAADTWWMVKEVAKGKTYSEVAEEFNAQNEGYQLTKYRVRDAVEEAMVEWKRENIANIDAYIARDLMRIEEIERKVMDNFELSKSSLRPNEYASLMKRGLSPDEIDEMYASRPMPGDPRYLEVLLHLQQQRLRLLGIDKGSDVEQKTVVQYQFNGIGDEALSRMADMLQDGKYKEVVDEQG